MRTILSCVLATALFGGCTAGSSDDSMYLTGTEEEAVTLANGEKACTNPKKVLVCHIPPGNPANAHDICVGARAVEPHQTNHGDTVGPCVAEPPPPDVDAGVPEVDAPDPGPGPL